MTRVTQYNQRTNDLLNLHPLLMYMRDDEGLCRYTTYAHVHYTIREICMYAFTHLHCAYIMNTHFRRITRALKFSGGVYAAPIVTSAK